MKMHESYNDLQLREVFHLEFLKSLGGKVKVQHYALKGGVNLRFFFNSIRYSEDIDLDVQNLDVVFLRDRIMQILTGNAFHERLIPFGIRQIVPPDIAKAKQTETTQRFKVHLLTATNEDLFTKIEFSRRGFTGTPQIQPVADSILSQYKSAPVIVPHYDIASTFLHKINALAHRTITQARDIFDLYMLSSQIVPAQFHGTAVTADTIKKARENVFSISYLQFRDTVLSYISIEDQGIYDNEQVWDEIRVKVVDTMESLLSRE